MPTRIFIMLVLVGRYNYCLYKAFQKGSYVKSVGKFLPKFKYTAKTFLLGDTFPGA